MSLVNFTLTNVTLKLNSIFLNKNSKRGLLDGIGKTWKFFFGTLTENDKTEIIERYGVLNKNHHNLEKQLKTQLSILQPLSKILNETISHDSRWSNARFIRQQTR